jgi:hypothetical protein
MARRSRADGRDDNGEAQVAAIIRTSPTAACRHRSDIRLRVVLSTKGAVERETGLEPATFSLEGLGG